jgi:DNA polymerase-3 subunit alpha
LFLGRLWAGDGFINGPDNHVPFYATSSPQLATDVQTLLLRLGVLSGVHAKQFKYRGQLRPGFTVHLLGEDSIQTFADVVLPHAVGRAGHTTELRAYLRSTIRGLTSKDTIPVEVRAWVDDERQQAGLTWSAEVQSGVSMQEFYGRLSPSKQGFRRETIARLAKFLGSERLRQAATSDVFWGPDHRHRAAGR